MWRSCVASDEHRWRRFAKRSSRPISGRWRPSCPRGRAWIATPARARESTACARCSYRCRVSPLPVEIWERDVLPRRIGAYSQTWLDSLCASGEVVWVGAGSIGRELGKGGAVLPRGCAADRSASRAALGRASSSHRALASTTSCASGSRAGPPSSPTCSRSSTSRGDAPRGLVGSGVGGRGDERRVGAAARPAFDTRPRRTSRPWWRIPLAGSAAAAGPTAGRSMTGRSRFGTRRRGAQAQVQGRWSLTASLFGEPADLRPRVLGSASAAPLARAPPRARRAVARALRDRHPRAGPRRGDPRRLCAAVRLVCEIGDPGCVPQGLLHRGDGRRAVRAAWRGRAFARRPISRSARQAADTPSRADDRGGARTHTAGARRRRPGAALWRRAALA